MKIDTLLYSLIFGESVLNDAVSIVLFNTFKLFYISNKNFTSKSIGILLLNFASISIGSCFIGILIGLFCSFFFKHTNLKNYPEYEIALLLLFAYGSYAFAESINYSGIMSLFFNGIILSHYNDYNLSKSSRITFINVLKSFALLCDFFVYLRIGMVIFTDTKIFKNFNFLFAILALFICLLSRFFNTFPLSFIANLFRYHGGNRLISYKMQTVIWFAGLRGAISFALV